MYEISFANDIETGRTFLSDFENCC